MNKIGFKNFRRFENFDPIEYRGITFLVGQNNSGKSTLVKALLLCIDFLKTASFTEFAFSNNMLESANIVTYKRAKYSKAKTDENYIVFNLVLNDFELIIKLTGRDEDTTARILQFDIKKLSIGYLIGINIDQQTISFSSDSDLKIHTIDEEVSAEVMLEREIKTIENDISKIKDIRPSKEYIYLVDRLNSLKDRLKELKIHNKDSKLLLNEFESLFPAGFEKNDLFELIENFIEEKIVEHGNAMDAVYSGKKTTEENFKFLQSIKRNYGPIRRMFKELKELVQKVNVVYLGASASKQSALFPIRDKNNALSQAIHEFHQLKIEKGTVTYRFLTKWMKVFGIGDDLEIIQHAGEAYEVLISSHETKIQLADKGMGSVQAMMLILRIACIIGNENYQSKNTIVIVEEPELNLHPALQSKIADLLLEVHNQYHLTFIIETHSEYILRKSQVLVAENDFEIQSNDNPFFVYYFPIEFDQKPYQLNYQQDGTFDKNFGTGFFDAASLDTLKLLRIKREKQS